MIEKLIPGSKTKIRIVKAIYNNPNINITALIKIVKTSPNLVLDYVNLLVDHDVLLEKKIGGHKKTHIRIISPNLKSELGKKIFSLVETDKKIEFFNKYKILKSFFIQLEEFKKDIDYILIYGSYARFSATRDSDLDLIIVGNLIKKQIIRIEEIFVTLDCELSLKIESFDKFKHNLTKPLYKNIIENHIITYGETKFIKMLGENK